jgi:glycerate kinase
MVDEGIRELHEKNIAACFSIINRIATEREIFDATPGLLASAAEQAVRLFLAGRG